MAVVLELSDDQRAELSRFVRAQNERARVVRQARVVLALADGVSVRQVARDEKMSSNTVLAWRDLFEARGLDGLGVIGPGRGRKPIITSDTIEAIVHDTLHTLPDDDSECWSTRTLGARHGVGKDIVAKLWRKRRLRPWKRSTFKLSTDPNFEAKLVDIVALYMDPPDHAAVFCFDEKTQIQALDRTQPSLPMIPGRAGTLTHDYKRNGTIDLFAALNIGTGEVLHDLRPRHAGTDVLSFFKWIDAHVPADLEVHVVLDNLSAHSSEPVRRWLALPAQARWHLHFTPTSSSWLNLVECWFSVLTRKRLTNSAFRSVKELRLAIETWVEHWNDNPHPFIWRKTADEILESVNRARATLKTVSTKTATHH
jgi:transposase